MIDAFDLLGQPRVPWLDQEKLKSAYLVKTLKTHPDTRAANPAEGSVTFAEVNEAFQILQDPKRRLHHLLSLENYSSAATGSAIPENLAQLFAATIEVVENSGRALEKFKGASNALSQALLKPKLLEARTSTEEHLKKIARLYECELETLQEMNTDWRRDSRMVVGKLNGIYLQLSYLTRWKTQLEEKLFQLLMT